MAVSLLSIPTCSKMVIVSQVISDSTGCGSEYPVICNQ